jgi:cytidylate kinase
MTVIAMTKELGTHYEAVAKALARRLGLAVFYHGIPARPLPPQGGSHPLRRSTDGLALEFEDFLRGSSNETLQAAEELCNLALNDNAIVCGPGVAALFLDIPQVSKIRVRATMALRVKQIMAASGAENPEPSVAAILDADRREAHLLTTSFGIVNPEEATLYDLVVDTGRAPMGACIEAVLEVLRQPHFGDARAMRALLLQRALRLRGALARRRQSRPGAAPSPKPAANPGVLTEKFPSTPMQSYVGQNLGMTANQGARVEWAVA